MKKPTSEITLTKAQAIEMFEVFDQAVVDTYKEKQTINSRVKSASSLNDMHEAVCHLSALQDRRKRLIELRDLALYAAESTSEDDTAEDICSAYGADRDGIENH